MKKFRQMLFVGSVYLFALSLCCFTQAQVVGEADFGAIRIQERMIRIGGGLREFEFGAVNNFEEPMNAQGAILKTNPDLELDLEKAERYKNDGNYDVACQLWQIVLDKSGDTLYSDDGEVYFSMVRQVEKILATLPEKGLSVYRIKADAEAAQIMAKGRGPLDEQSLSRVVRQYFVSSIGDDAAFKLACLNLDNHDFIGAQRLLQKIVEQHPDPSIPLDQLFVRISLCQAVMGDPLGAKATLTQARELTDGSAADLINLVASAIKDADSDSSEITLGSSGSRFSKFRVMPSLPKDFLDLELECLWQIYVDVSEVDELSSNTNVLIGESAHGTLARKTVERSEELPMLDIWRDAGWRPTGKLLFENGLVYFKSPNRMTAWRTDQLGASPAWKSSWANYYLPDDSTRLITQLSGNGSGRPMGGRPAKKAHVLYFGDHIAQEMTIHQNVLYTLEGPDKKPPKGRRSVVQPNIGQRRGRDNHLVAYEAKSGKALWALPKFKSDDMGKLADPNAGDNESSDFIVSGGFMAAPIGYDNLLLVPVNTGGTIWVYALDANQHGKTVWKSFLCDEPESGAEPWAPIQMSLSGSNLIVNCGTGVVFVLDASTGLIQFAKRYRRIGQSGGNPVQRMRFDGWSADQVIPYGNQMICFCSDTNVIDAFDIATGKSLWHVDMAPIGMNKLDYVLGIQSDVLYLAGSETVLAFDLKSEGMMLWGGEALFDGKKSNGRGMLTPDGIYLPIEDSVWKFDLNGSGTSARKIASATVDLGTGAPIGNLFSDGQRIWAIGANRVYALGPSETPENN